MVNFERRGWHKWKESDQDDWNIWWASVYSTKQVFSSDSHVRLGDHQLINHFPNHYEITRKDLMVKNVKRYRKELQREGRDTSVLDFVPTTFVLPGDYALFAEEYRRKPNTTWILKPSARAQGKGIFLINKLSQVRKWYATQWPGAVKVNSSDAYVVSRYIQNPLLVGGKKFDLRRYVCVRSYRPLQAYKSSLCFARFCNFKYTEDEARQFFDELDRNKDGVVTLEDMRVEMRRRNLPEKYAKDFIKRAKRHAKWPLGNSIVWEDFRSLNQERESAMLANFNRLDVSQFGSLKRHQIKSLLQKMEFPASDDNADSMLRYLDADASGYVSYGKYRNFLILIPREKIEAKDIGLMWFESATMVPMIVPTNSSKKMLVLSTLASAVISGTSTLALHPLDTVKTMLQASQGGTILSVFKDAAKLGRRGLYKGIIPATAGAASSQGFRVGVFEAVKLGTKVLLPSIPDLQVQTIASGMGSFIGTAVRIPCEVLKQRLQAGQYTSVWTATSAVMKRDGVSGLFRGSAATLSREIPFYVIGMVAYEQFKKAALAWSREKRGRDLDTLETVALGALSGAVAAALTTPFDVLKTRLMTQAVGAQSVTIRQLAAKLVKEEGPGVLFKGALPRALWIAPVGAMNFAGYELAKNALDSSQ